MNSASVSVAYNPNQEECVSFCEKFLIPIVARDLEELYENCDAVYIASPHYTHYEYAKSALNAGKPVLCETPLYLVRSRQKNSTRLQRKRFIASDCTQNCLLSCFRALILSAQIRCDW